MNAETPTGVCTWIVTRTLKRQTKMHTTKIRKTVLAVHEGGGFIRATFGEYRIGTQAPYWSVTADISSTTKFTSRSVHTCGQCHEAVVENFPELAHTLRWHLATNGIPRHYVPNAQYWHDMANGKIERGLYDPEPKAVFVKHVVELEGENANAWLELPWADVELILTERVSKLQAAYKADVLDQLAALERL